MSRPVALVTGAGSGIGAATARRLAQTGWDVGLVGRRREPLDAVAEEVAALGATAVVAPADMGEVDAVRACVAAVGGELGRIDGVVANAATVFHQSLADWDVERFDEHLSVNVRGPFFLVQAALEHLRASPQGAVVTVSSSSGTIVRPTQCVYGMTKSALEYMTRSLAAELAPEGIRVNCVAPGPVDTPIHATWADDLDEAYRWLAAEVPLGRIAAADELALWIERLLDPSAGFVTGTVMPVDGGQVLDHR